MHVCGPSHLHVLNKTCYRDSCSATNELRSAARDTTGWKFPDCRAGPVYHPAKFLILDAILDDAELFEEHLS